MKKIKLQFILLLGIFLIAFFLRFYKLGEVPYGFYQDESAIGYNAYSIMQTGKDEYGKSFPLYFKSFGDQKLPVYIYSAIVPIKLFGMNEFAVRFPSAFFGLLTVIAFYFFVKAFTDNKKLALIATALLAINPWHLHYSRATFEVSICLFLFVTGSLLLHMAFTQKKRGTFLLGTMLFVLCMYTYNLTRLLSPLLFIIILILFRNNIKRLPKSEIAGTMIVAVFSLLPFAATLFGSGGAQSASGTLIFSSASVLAPIVELRSYLIVLPEFFVKIFFNTNLLIIFQYVQNIAGYLSVPFFFISGSTHGNHGIGNVGQLYLFELPFFLTGLFSIFTKRSKGGIFILLWGLVVVLVSALTRDIPHATRSFSLIVTFEIISAWGLISSYSYIKNIQNSYLKKIVFLIVSICIVFNIIYYFSSYYIKFPVQYAKAWRSEDKRVSLYIKEHEAKYKKIIFDQNAGFIYTSLLFYAQYNPEEFQRTVVRLPDDNEGFSVVKSFGKYEFRDINWTADTKSPDTLIITTTDRKPNEVPPLITFFYPKRPVAFSVKQQVMSYPIEEPAYVLIKTN